MCCPWKTPKINDPYKTVNTANFRLFPTLYITHFLTNSLPIKYHVKPTPRNFTTNNENMNSYNSPPKNFRAQEFLAEGDGIIWPRTNNVYRQKKRLGGHPFPCSGSHCVFSALKRSRPFEGKQNIKLPFPGSAELATSIFLSILAGPAIYSAIRGAEGWVCSSQDGLRGADACISVSPALHVPHQRAGHSTILLLTIYTEQLHMSTHYQMHEAFNWVYAHIYIRNIDLWAYFLENNQMNNISYHIEFMKGLWKV